MIIEEGLYSSEAPYLPQNKNKIWMSYKSLNENDYLHASTQL